MCRSARGTRTALLALLAVVASAAAAEAQQGSRVLGIEGTILDLVPRVEDLGPRTRLIEVKETAEEIRVELRGDVLFDFDQASLREDAVATLREVADLIRRHEGRPVRIEGHTDSKGRDSYNQRLSERRAASVRDWLVANEGLTAVRFEVKGYGETRPAAPNTKPDGSDDPEGRQKNRRVEIVIGK